MSVRPSRCLISLATPLLAVPLAAVWSPPARADDYAGDLKATKVAFIDATGHGVASVKKGAKVTARYTITNTEKFNVKITGVDSQAQVGSCAKDFARDSRETNPGTIFPIYLKPGEKTEILSDVSYSLAADSTCESAKITMWKGNVLAVKVDTIPSPTPTALPTKAAATRAATEPTGSAPAEARADEGNILVPVAVVGASTAVLFVLLLGLMRVLAKRR